MIFLMRHGEDDPNRLGGWSAAGLTEEGKRQAEEAAEKLRRDFCSIRRLYASDLPRALETAQIVGAALGLKAELLPAFRETNNGELAGMEKSEARERYPGVYFAGLGFEERYPGGESPREFRDRIEAAWSVFRAEQEALGGDALLVTHAGVINVIMCRENGVTFTNRTMAYRTGFAGMVQVDAAGGGKTEKIL